MRTTVQLLHPAPVLHVPARSRDARIAFAPIVTEVRIRDLSASEAPEGPLVPAGSSHVLATRLVDGEIWRPIGCSKPGSDRHPGPSGEAFLSWLSGEEGARGLDESETAQCMEGSPILARLPGQRTTPRPYAPWNAGRQGRMIVDGRDEAPGAARAFAESQLALVSGVPYMRMPGPLAYRDPGMDHVRINRLPGAWTSNPGVGRGIFFRADRLEDLARFEGRKLGSLEANWGKEILDGVRMREDDDLELVLRDAMRAFVTPIVRWSGEDPYSADRTERLMRFATLGTCALIPDDELLDVCELVRGLSGDILGNERNARTWLGKDAERLSRYATEVAVPRLSARLAADPEDLASLSSLGL